MLMWPAVAVLGFFALTWLVIALAASSTARYDFERNRVEEAPAHDRAMAAAARDTSPRVTRTARSRKATARQPSSPRFRAGVTMHPAGSRLPDGESSIGWWLIDGEGRVAAGPFADRLEAEWAAFAEAPTAPSSARVVHGVRTVTGGLLPRQAPQESAWMLELGQQLTRLGEDWFELATDTDPLTTLVVEVTEALIEAGLPLHDCSGRGSLGGVCLTPYSESAGILVSWHGHERMTLQQVHGAEADAALRRTMSAAVADVLLQRGFDVAALGKGCGHLVTSIRR